MKRKNNSYQAPQGIRENTAIPLSNIKDRKTFIKQKIKIGLSPVTQDNENQFLVDKKILLSALNPNTVDNKYYPQIAAVYPQSDDAPIIKPKLLANVAQFTIGKMVCINLKFYDNAEAGKSKSSDIRSVTSGAQGGDDHYYFTDVQRQFPILFTNTFGEIDNVRIVFSSLFGISLSDISITNENTAMAKNEHEQTVLFYDTMKALPKM
jgi:hypothetical protein